MADIADYFKYLGGLRHELVVLLHSIEDAGWDFQSDETRPNWLLKKDTEQIINNYQPQTAQFGVFVVEKHTNCRLPKSLEDEGDFEELLNMEETLDVYGLGKKLYASNFTWTTYMVDYQNVDSSNCNCSLHLDHCIIREIVHTPDAIGVKAQSDIWGKIYSVKDRCKNRERRAVIREQLLLAILAINKELHRLIWDGL